MTREREWRGEDPGLLSDRQVLPCTLYKQGAGAFQSIDYQLGTGDGPHMLLLGQFVSG